MGRKVAAVVASILFFGCSAEVDESAAQHHEAAEAAVDPVVAGPADPVEEPAPMAPVELLYRTPNLANLAEQAVETVPKWLRGDLTLTLMQLEDTVQDELAGMILTVADKRLVDEIAFSIAHLSPEVLSDPKFHPWILHENAEQVYARDEILQYVELIEEADYTTARYRVEVDGEVVERTIDRDTYYWYVVHPRIEDERPYYIDPQKYCPDLKDQCPTTAEAGGRFWREFLWDGHQAYCTGAPDPTACPMMEDYLKGVDVLWKGGGGPDDNGAIGQLIKWVQARQYFGAKGERSIQPVRIAVLGRGNCGEWADMTTAVARTALIPNHNVGARANDHTWNEFWDGRWVQWEPVGNKVDNTLYYLTPEGEAGGNPCYAVTATRGDAFVWDRSEDYANTFELVVEVRDADGRPVDGAMVYIYGPNTTYERMAGTYWYASEGVTDFEGIARITLGEKRTIAVRVESGIGNWPAEDNKVNTVVADSIAGQTETVAVSLSGTMPPFLSATKVDADPGDEPLHFEIDEVVSGYRILGSGQYDATFSLEHDKGKLDRFALDAENYALFEAGEPFEAVYGTSLDLPADRQWTLVLANADPRATAAVGDLTVNDLTVDFALLPGDHLAIDLTP